MISHQLSLPCQIFQRFLFKLCLISVDIIENLRLEHEERSIYPTFSRLGFFRETNHTPTVEVQMTITCRRTDSGQSGQFSMRAVKREKLIKVYVGNTVTPGEHESLASKIGLEIGRASCRE